MTPTKDRGGVGLSMADWEKESRRWLADMRKAPQPDHMADMCDFYIGKIVEMQRALAAAALRPAPPSGLTPDVERAVRAGIHADLVRAKKYAGPVDEKDSTVLRCCIVCDIVRAMKDEDIATLTPPAAPGPGR